MSTVIIGAGIIGTSTAYYLSQSGHTSPNDIHLIEASPQLFASASGYAAGFLARDWFTDSLSSLGRLSFDLHKQLAQVNNGQEKWGYSQSTGTSLEEAVGKRGEDWLGESVNRVRAANQSRKCDQDKPVWLGGRTGNLDVISNDETTAQMYVSSLHSGFLSFSETLVIVIRCGSVNSSCQPASTEASSCTIQLVPFPFPTTRLAPCLVSPSPPPPHPRREPSSHAPG